MTIWWLAVALSCLAAAGLAFIWVAVRIGSRDKAASTKQQGTSSLNEAVEDDVSHIFNDEFREELRNRGRLHFEKIIGENAMFLQQDLRLTTSQLNEYMKAEITKKLQEEFQKYEQSIMDAKQLAVDSIEKTNAAVEEQRKSLGETLEKEVGEEKQRQLQRFEQNMAEVVNHYVLAAVGNQIDLSDQLDFILNELESNKQAIIEDIRSGA